MLKPTEKEFTEVVKEVGSFTFKFPNLLDDLKADAITSKLLAGNENPTITAANIATMLGTLTNSIVSKPSTFDLEEICSYEELEAVYTAFVSKVLAFRRTSALAKQSGTEDKGDEGGKEPQILVPEKV